MKLATKVITTGIFVLTLILGAMGIYGYTVTKSSISDLLDKQLESNVKLISTRIEKNRDDIVHITKVFSKHKTIKKSLTLLESRGVNQILNEVIRITPIVNYVLLVDADGLVFASSTVGTSGEKIFSEQLLLQDVTENPMFPVVNSLSSVISGKPGKDPYLQTLNIKRELTQWFIAPVLHRGDAIGWVIISIDWKASQKGVLKDIIEEFKKTEVPIIATLIADENKKILVSETNEEISNAVTFEYSKELPFSEDMLYKTDKVEFGLTDYDFVIVVDKERVFKPLEEITKVSIIVAALGGSLLWLALYLLLEKGLLSRLKLLGVGSDEIGKGNLDYKIKDLGKDEIGDLARSINEMSSNLQKITTSKDKLDEEAQKAQKALLELNEQKHALDSHAIVGITDISGKIIYVNDKFVEISGYSKEELIGGNHRIVNSSHHSKKFWKEMYDTVRHGKVWHSEVCNQNKSGELYWVDTTIVPFLDENGRPKSYIAIRTDITYQKNTEAEILKAKEAAEASTKAKSEFLASMSHEIRTPMNGVIGMLELLESSELEQNQRHQVEVAHTSANSLLSLINEILDFSKIEAGKLEIENIEFNIVEELGSFIDAFGIRAAERRVELILDLVDVKENIISSDPLRLRQILNNLLGNAIKFTEEGGEIVVKAILDTRDEAFLTISVKDTGIGIPQDKLEILFDSFTQVDASTTRKYGGTGLGLAITQKLCRLMGGEISVKSKEGEGSEFKITIPVTLGVNSSIIMPSVAIENLKALIVDDNFTNRMILKAQLSAWGIRSISAEDAYEAMEILKSESFDIAFLDMQMPGMDGEELGKTIRSQEKYDHMKMIMMTSLGSRADAKRYADIGFDAFFPKPTTRKDLFKALNVLVEGGEALKKAHPLVTSDYLGTLQSEEEIEFKGDYKILLVEDNLVNQSVATGMLETFNLTADIANNGLEAVKFLKANEGKVDLVLMDCMMPEMDGYTATEYIRESKAGEANKKLPIIAMTANAMKGDKEKCFAAGMDDYISKPININELKLTLAKWLLGKEVTVKEEVEKEPKESLPWNKEGLLKRLGNNEALIPSVLKVFVNDVRDLNIHLKEAIEVKDLEKCRLHSHSIKGSAGNIAAEKLADAAKRSEIYSEEGSFEKVEEEFKNIENYTKEALEILENYLENNTKNTSIKSTIDRVHLEELLKELTTELNSGSFIDSEELELFKVSFNESVDSLLEELNKKVDQFALDEALEIIEKIKTEIEDE